MVKGYIKTEENFKDLLSSLMQTICHTWKALCTFFLKRTLLVISTSESAKAKFFLFFFFGRYLPKLALLTPWHRPMLFIQLIYSCFLITINHWLHFLYINPHTTHNPSNCSDEELTHETPAFKLLMKVTLRFQLSW